jgi:hypothetical protein
MVRLRLICTQASIVSWVMQTKLDAIDLGGNETYLETTPKAKRAAAAKAIV